MAAPVQFNVSISPMPVREAWTAQQLATDIADRLTVSPADSWTAFQVISSTVGVAPTADYGPVLLSANSGTYSGKTVWLRWDSSTGAYKHVDLDGAYLLDASVTLAKLADVSAAGSVLITDATKTISELTAASGSSGQVLTLVGGTTPTWVDTFVPSAPGNYFEANMTAPQVINTGGVLEIVEFDNARIDPSSQFDAANFRFQVSEGEIWYFYAQVQVADSGAATTAWDLQLDVRPQGVAGDGFGTYESLAAAIETHNLRTSGIIAVAAGVTYVDVALTCNGTGADIAVEANVTNTRFGGYRIL